MDKGSHGEVPETGGAFRRLAAVREESAGSGSHASAAEEASSSLDLRAGAAAMRGTARRH